MTNENSGSEIKINFKLENIQIISIFFPIYSREREDTVLCPSFYKKYPVSISFSVLLQCSFEFIFSSSPQTLARIVPPATHNKRGMFSPSEDPFDKLRYNRPSAARSIPSTERQPKAFQLLVENALSIEEMVELNEKNVTVPFGASKFLVGR